mmetsp:Transcript_71307/g.128346  ORF Transcript_71307/g.128346 Transcript_71307/m.128346 type:complete len:158 (+) Transcript_71307:60-533(+)
MSPYFARVDGSRSYSLRRKSTTCRTFLVSFLLLVSYTRCPSFVACKAHRVKSLRSAVVSRSAAGEEVEPAIPGPAAGKQAEVSSTAGDRNEDIFGDWFSDADPTSGGVLLGWLVAGVVLYFVYLDIALGGRCLPSGLNMYGKFCDSASLLEVFGKHP